MPIAAIFAEEAAAALAAELAPYAAGEAALAIAPTLLAGAEFAGLTAAPGALGAEALLGADAMAANAAAGGAGAGSAGINAAQVGAQQAAAQGINAIPQAQTFPVSGFEPAPLSKGLADPALAAQPVPPPPPPPAPPANNMGLNMPGAYAPEPMYSGMGMEGQLPADQFIEGGSGGIPSPANSIAQANITSTPPSALEIGMDKAIKFAEKNPFTAMTGAYMGANALGLLKPSGATFNDKPYDGPLSRYRLSDSFQGRTANPADFQYTPRYATGGGIMGAGSYDIPVGYDTGGMSGEVPGYAKGGSLSESIEQYQKMLSGQQQAAPAASRDVGIYYDQDPDTRYQDALTAAQIRQAKVNQRAYVSPPAAKRPTPLGQLKMPTSGKSKSGDDVEAARGGIMQSYADGGVTGSGSLDLNIPLSLGGGGGGGTPAAGGAYIPAGGGGGGGQDYGNFGSSGGGGFGAGSGGLGPSSGGGGFLQQILGALGGGMGSYGGGSVRPPPTPSMFEDMSMPLVQRPQQGFNTMPAFEVQQEMKRPSGMPMEDIRTMDEIGNHQFNMADQFISYAQPPKNQYPARMSNLANSAAQRSMFTFAQGGGISSLGGYAAGGNPRLLKGPGDGMSDNIPATINGRQPARLADGEFVIPADVVSHLGNGSTEAGANQLHGMMDRVRKARTGNPKQGKQINPKKYMPK